MAKSDSYNISMTTVKLSVASPGLRRPGREQRRPEHIGLGDDRATGGLGEQLAADPLPRCVRPGVRMHQGAPGGPAQPLVEGHPVPQ